MKNLILLALLPVLSSCNLAPPNTETIMMVAPDGMQTKTTRPCLSPEDKEWSESSKLLMETPL